MSFDPLPLSTSQETAAGDTPHRMDRRRFLKILMTAAAAVGLSSTTALRWAEAAAAGKLKPSVIWLHFQECTGCTESLLRTSHPDIARLILELVSLDYHETLLAAAGHQAEQALRDAMAARKGEYVLVVEGAIPTKDGGIYCMIGGRTAREMLEETARDAGAIIAIGSCASFGGLPAADPNPTGAVGVGGVVTGRPVVTIPGCPPNPYNFLGTVLQYVTMGRLPELDALGRPRFAYGRTIHEHCPRRPHFDAGHFAEHYGDAAHREGACLYRLGCKGPMTHANCSTQHFGETNAWPIGIGHPCIGCTEQALLWRTSVVETVEIEHPTPPDTYPPAHAEHGGVSPAATGLAGLAAGALLGAGAAYARRLDRELGEEPDEEA